ncbi:MAG: MBL fold metallo-hydrolase [Promethearchaeota archaeon]
MIRIKKINHACFMIELGGKIIYFDPYQIPDDAEKADIILVSHDHFDHFEEKSADNIKKEDTKFVCPKSCKKIISSYNANGINPGESIDIEGINVKGVESYTLNKPFHPKSNKWLGFIISDGNIKVYHAGDTYLIPEMKNFKELDFALIPIGNKEYTMDIDEAVEATKIMKPVNILPMHAWDPGNLDIFEKKVKNELPEVNVIKLQQGESFTQ